MKLLNRLKTSMSNSITSAFGNNIGMTAQSAQADDLLKEIQETGQLARWNVNISSPGPCVIKKAI